VLDLSDGPHRPVGRAQVAAGSVRPSARQSATFFERHRTNYLVSRLVSSAAAIETAVTSTVRDMLRESFTLIFFLAAAFYYNWRLTLGSLIIAPIIAFLTAKFGKALRNRARESFEGSKELTDTAQEALANQGIVKAYRAEKRESARFTAVAQRIVRANRRSASIAGASPPTIEMIGMLFVVFLLFFGQQEIMAGRMNTAQFVTFLFFLFRSYDPMRKLSRLQNSMEQAFAAAQHVWEVIDEHAAIDREGRRERSWRRCKARSCCATFRLVTRTNRGQFCET
jgi:subfamily B ATP-binding cassette protein MsbA